jgi:hypothetical protein
MKKLQGKRAAFPIEEQILMRETCTFCGRLQQLVRHTARGAQTTEAGRPYCHLYQVTIDRYNPTRPILGLSTKEAAQIKNRSVVSKQEGISACRLTELQISLIKHEFVSTRKHYAVKAYSGREVKLVARINVKE